MDKPTPPPTPEEKRETKEAEMHAQRPPLCEEVVAVRDKGKPKPRPYGERTEKP
jgi:hypothetical protein